MLFLFRTLNWKDSLFFVRICFPWGILKLSFSIWLPGHSIFGVLYRSSRPPKKNSVVKMFCYKANRLFQVSLSYRRRHCGLWDDRLKGSICKRCLLCEISDDALASVAVRVFLNALLLSGNCFYLSNNNWIKFLFRRHTPILNQFHVWLRWKGMFSSTDHVAQ